MELTSEAPTMRVELTSHTPTQFSIDAVVLVTARASNLDMFSHIVSRAQNARSLLMLTS